MTTTTNSRLAEEPGIRFGIANGVLVAVLPVAAIARLEVAETEFMAAIVAGLVSVGLSVAMTASISMVAWALLTGFVANRYGELTFDQGDLVRLGVVAVSVITLAVLTRRIYQVIKKNAPLEPQETPGGGLTMVSPRAVPGDNVPSPGRRARDEVIP